LKPVAHFFVHHYFLKKGVINLSAHKKTELPHKLAQTGTNWHKLAQTGTNWHKLAQSGTNLHKQAQTGTNTNRHKPAQTGTIFVPQEGGKLTCLLMIFCYSSQPHLHTFPEGRGTAVSLATQGVGGVWQWGLA
jgi:hypothetical protein